MSNEKFRNISLACVCRRQVEKISGPASNRGTIDRNRHEQEYHSCVAVAANVASANEERCRYQKTYFTQHNIIHLATTHDSVHERVIFWKFLAHIFLKKEEIE
jgi:hypothetical protein